VDPHDAIHTPLHFKTITGRLEIYRDFFARPRALLLADGVGEGRRGGVTPRLPTPAHMVVKHGWMARLPSVECADDGQTVLAVSVEILSSRVVIRACD
jgi:hypothetical protein